MPKTYHRTCEYCRGPFTTPRHNQRTCSVACRAELRRGPRGWRDSNRGKVAEQLVRSWSPARRKRIRDLLLTLITRADQDGILASPEFYVVLLIDKISEEEKVA